MTAQLSKKTYTQRLITTTTCLGLLAVGSLVAARYGEIRNGNIINSKLAANTTPIADTEWHVGEHVYEVPHIDPWIISINRDGYWQISRKEVDRAYLLNLILVDSSVAFTSEQKATLVGIEGVRLDKQELYFDGDEQRKMLLMTVQVPFGDDYLRAQYQIRGTEDAVNDEVIKDATAEFTSFVAGIKEKK